MIEQFGGGMALLEWKSEYLTGIDSLDTEHRWLIDSVNDFDEKCRQGDMTAAKNMFYDLKDYMQEHSQNEESMMSRFNYPDIESHRKEHKKIALIVLKAEHRFEQVDGFPSAEIKGFIFEYFYNHIMVYDRAFGEFVKSAGKE
jgi:hemerythrin